MTTPHHQFSLWAMFVAFTALVVLIALAANNLAVAIAESVFAMPFLAASALMHFAGMPRFGRFVMALCGILIVSLSINSFIIANRDNEMSVRMLFSQFVLGAYGVLYCGAAWLIPSRDE